MRSGHTHTAHQLTLGEGRSLGSTAELVGIVTTTLNSLTRRSIPCGHRSLLQACRRRRQPIHRLLAYTSVSVRTALGNAATISNQDYTLPDPCGIPRPRAAETARDTRGLPIRGGPTSTPETTVDNILVTRDHRPRRSLDPTAACYQPAFRPNVVSAGTVCVCAQPSTIVPTLINRRRPSQAFVHLRSRAVRTTISSLTSPL